MAEKAAERRSLAQRLETTEADLKKVIAALEDLGTAQEKELAAPEGSKKEEQAGKEVEKAEETVEKVAAAAGLSDEDVNRIADRVISRWGEMETQEKEEAAAAAAGNGKTELEKLEAGETTTPPASPPGTPEGVAPPAESPPPPDETPEKVHWSQRKLFSGSETSE